MIDSLPELVVEIIIDRFLSYEDLINLKLTCKRLKNIVDQKKIKIYLFFLLIHALNVCSTQMNRLATLIH